MQVKTCLKCGIDYQPIKETRKFCSTSCRVMWYRKNKPQQVEKILLKDLILSLIDKLDSINFITQPSNYDVLKTEIPQKPLPTKKVVIIRSYENFLHLKKSCETAEDWVGISHEIRESDNLTEKQKVVLLKVL